MGGRESEDGNEKQKWKGKEKRKIRRTEKQQGKTVKEEWVQAKEVVIDVRCVPKRKGR